MSALSNNAEDLLLTYLLTATAVTRPTAWYAAIHTEDPTEDGTAGEVETRQSITFADPVTDSGQSLSSNAPSWTMTGDRTITHLSIWDAVSGGDCIIKGELLVQKVLLDTEVLTFTAGDIVASLA